MHSQRKDFSVLFVLLPGAFVNWPLGLTKSKIVLRGFSNKWNQITSRHSWPIKCDVYCTERQYLIVDSCQLMGPSSSCGLHNLTANANWNNLLGKVETQQRLIVTTLHIQTFNLLAPEKLPPLLSEPMTYADFLIKYRRTTAVKQEKIFSQ